MNAEQLVTLIKAALADIKAQDVVALSVNGMTSIADHIVIASGTSTRHVKSIADRVIEHVKEAGVRPLGVEGDAQSDWVLVDIGDVVVHVMTPATRQFYDLERLWAPTPAATLKAQAPVTTASLADAAAAAAAKKTAARKPPTAAAKKPAARKPRASTGEKPAAKPRAPRRKPAE